jgi:hypothetical protein
VGPDGAKLDDLKIKLRLGRPKRGQAPAPRNQPKQLRVSATIINIQLWDHASEDGDFIEVRVNGSMQVAKFQIMHAPKSFPLTLTSGMNKIDVFAHNEGTGSPNTCSAEISHVVEGETLIRWGLKTGESGIIHAAAP